MLDFSKAYWQAKENLYKLKDVDNLLAYITPTLNEKYKTYGFNFIFWIYDTKGKKKFNVAGDMSSRTYKTFDEAEQALHDQVIHVLEDLDLQ